MGLTAGALDRVLYDFNLFPNHEGHPLWYDHSFIHLCWLVLMRKTGGRFPLEAPRRHTALPHRPLPLRYCKTNAFCLTRFDKMVVGWYYSPLPINFLLVKLNHHLLGLPSPPSSYTRASNLVASSCRTWDMYCRRISESCLSRGGSYI